MSRGGIAGVAAGAGLVMVALVVASTGQSPRLLSRPSTAIAPVVPTIGEPTLTARPRETVTPEGVQGWDSTGLLSAIVQVVVAAVVVAVLVLLFLAVRDLLRRVQPRITTHEEPSFSGPVPEALLDGADSGLDALTRGEPRNAIVATWVVLEEGAAAAGLPRHAAETSTEYVHRVLRSWDVDPRSLGELAALFREARFSTHALVEEHRSRALRALATIRADLGRSRPDADPALGDSATRRGSAR